MIVIVTLIVIVIVIVTGSKVGAVFQCCNAVLEGCVRSLLPGAWMQRIGQQTQPDGQLVQAAK